MDDLEHITNQLWFLAHAADMFLAGGVLEAIEVHLLRVKALEEGRLSEPEFRKVQRQYLDHAVERVKTLMAEAGARPIVRWRDDHPEIQPWPPSVN